MTRDQLESVVYIKILGGRIRMEENGGSEIEIFIGNLPIKIQEEILFRSRDANGYTRFYAKEGVYNG